MPRPVLEVAGIFRGHGAASRHANRGHASLGQLKVMSAIERCRTAALGGHVARCESGACGHTVIAFNSCRNRHCPKCQGSAAREWLAERQAELLHVPYFHVVYTLPAPIASIAYQNKAAIYSILFKASAEATLRIAADPKRLGARIGITSVLHTWGSAMTHHPHIHMIVPGGGLSADGERWIGGRPDYLLPVPVLSQLFRGLVLSMLLEAQAEGRLKFFGEHAALAGKKAFKAFLSPLWGSDWVVYAKNLFPAPMIALRERLCDEIGVAADIMPFAGELIEVRKEAADWEGAAERLLHSFADIDWASVALEIDAIEQERRALTEGSDVLKALRARQQDAEAESRDLRSKLEAATREESKLSERREALQQRRTVAKADIANVPDAQLAQTR
jgi:Transposase zinc-binding domain/Putative transposase